VSGVIILETIIVGYFNSEKDLLKHKYK